MFWTGATKSSCAGQYSECFFQEDSSLSEEKKLYSDNKGACVGVFFFNDYDYIAKTLPCESKAFLACQGSTIRIAEYAANRETDVSAFVNDNFITKLNIRIRALKLYYLFPLDSAR